ncbi:transcription factor bHLH95-like [Senna tora]|uniref:Transcription factor bHLH95-like n=1 Tax=Senna tora TaxID=362788 RepID=A0A834XAR7_9FABA|nr:transcription factor bHLH95-like [Senna tora]
MPDQERDPNMYSWPLSDFNNNNNDHLLQFLDFDNIDDVEPIKEGELEAEGGDGGGGGDGNNKTTRRRNRGKRSMMRSASGDDNKKDGDELDDDDGDVLETHIWTERERRKKMKNMFTDLHALLPHLPSKLDKATIIEEAVKYIQSLESELQKLQKRKEERLQLQQIHSASTTFDCPTSQWLQFAYDHNNNNNNNSSNNNNINGNNFLSAANNTENPINNIIGTSSNNNNNVNNYNNSLALGFQTWSSPNVVLNACGDLAHFCVCYPKKLRLYTTIFYVLEKYKIEVLSAHISTDHSRKFYMIQAQINGASNEFMDADSMVEIFKQAAAEMMMRLS